MLKLGRRARGHFVTLIEIRVHLIRVKPGHISAVALWGDRGKLANKSGRKILDTNSSMIVLCYLFDVLF